SQTPLGRPRPPLAQVAASARHGLRKRALDDDHHLHTRPVLAPTWRPDRLSASQPHLIAISSVISGCHDCKWCRESLSLIKSGLTELPVRHAMNWWIRAYPRPGSARAA